MKLEIYNGDYVGTAEWMGPGEVELDMPDADQRKWFEKYFSTEDAFLDGPVECAEMAAECRDSSEPAFERAAFQLAAYAYQVKRNMDTATQQHGAGSAGPQDKRNGSG